MKDEFDLWLESQLANDYVPFSVTSPRAGAPYRARSRGAGPGRLPRGLAARVAILGAAVAIGLTGTITLGVATATGSADPQVWGQYVKDAVVTCKGALASGQHDVGGCVRAITHKKAVRPQASRSADRRVDTLARAPVLRQAASRPPSRSSPDDDGPSLCEPC